MNDVSQNKENGTEFLEVLADVDKLKNKRMHWNDYTFKNCMIYAIGETVSEVQKTDLSVFGR